MIVGMAGVLSFFGFGLNFPKSAGIVGGDRGWAFAAQLY